MGEVNGRIDQYCCFFFLFFYVECDGHRVKYRFVGLVDSQSVLMVTNSFLHVLLMYYVHQSFTQYRAFNEIEL